jgi:hypothetical protein
MRKQALQEVRKIILHVTQLCRKDTTGCQELSR